MGRPPHGDPRYPSLTFLHSAAETIQGVGRPTFLYYFGDWDPSGVDIPRKVEHDLRGFAPDVDLTFERVAVNPDQIEEWSLPTRPTKATDTRSRSFHGASVEVDAIPPSTLRDLVTACITGHVDSNALDVTRRVEQEERAILEAFAAARRVPTPYSPDYPFDPTKE